ncbi:MAG TPA: hypothetical protein VNA12_07075, partial [Mycobacteriales bacterium]|nr:hypothetical protein [Mycobacteriales bacterium]
APPVAAGPPDPGAGAQPAPTSPPRTLPGSVVRTDSPTPATAAPPASFGAPLLPPVVRAQPDLGEGEAQTLGLPAGPVADGGTAQAVRRIATAVAKGAAFPFLLLLLVLLFLLVQHEIDRRDPKLALAPVYAEHDLAFSPPLVGAPA